MTIGHGGNNEQVKGTHTGKAGPVKPSVVHKKHELLNIIFVEYLVTLQSF